MIGNVSAWFESVGGRARGVGVPLSVSIKVTEPPHVRGGYVVDMDGAKAIAQFILWPNGAVEASALSVDTAERVFFKDASVQQVSDLDVEFDELARVVARLETQE